MRGYREKGPPPQRRVKNEDSTSEGEARAGCYPGLGSLPGKCSRDQPESVQRITLSVPSNSSASAPLG